MSRPRSRRIRLALVVAGTALLAACSPPSNAPQEYNDVTRTNFVQGCTGIVTIGTEQDAETSIVGEGADTGVCECQYDWFVENVPFDSEAAEAQGQGGDAVTFTELNQQLQDDPQSMPDFVKEGLASACGDAAPASGGPSGTAEVQSGTSVAPSDTTVVPTESTG
jgi:hypothetical protein